VSAYQWKVVQAVVWSFVLAGLLLFAGALL